MHIEINVWPLLMTSCLLCGARYSDVSDASENWVSKTTNNSQRVGQQQNTSTRQM
jgi:hypothetical protein